MPGPIRLLISDVDGTLVTPEKELTPASIAAVARLGEAGVAFAVTSGRPPKGMAMLVGPLALSTPISAFNGGVVVSPAMRTLEERVLPADAVQALIGELREAGLEVWAYRDAQWLVTDPQGAHVAREQHTVLFEPTVVSSLDGLAEGIAKLVGVSDDDAAIERATQATRAAYGERVSATTSQPYYLDITHPDANKGAVVRGLSARLGIPADQIAAIGDGQNDTLMFAEAGLTIAMGNANGLVQGAADHVTAANDAEGFAEAVERLVLPAAQT